MSDRIHDLPTGERPREKLSRLGPGSLDNAELLALFISTGTKGRSAITIGRDLLRKYGSLGALGALPVAELANEKGMGTAKASKLAAAFELGARVAREQLDHQPLDDPQTIYRHFAPQLAHLPHEQLLVVLLDSRLNHTGTQIISMGGVNETAAHPREILRPAITRAAYAFILIHNHPSGDPSPSKADDTVTRRISDAAELMGVRFFDHIIIGRPSSARNAYFSFREAGIIR